jgi:hypothetical protein
LNWLVTRAVLGGAAFGSAAVTLALAVLNASTSSASSSDTPAAYFFWFGANFVVAAVVAGTAGLAWHAFCQQQGWTSVHAYWTVGLLAGIAPGIVWMLPSGSSLITSFVLGYERGSGRRYWFDRLAHPPS